MSDCIQYLTSQALMKKTDKGNVITPNLLEQLAVKIDAALSNGMPWAKPWKQAEALKDTMVVGFECHGHGTSTLKSMACNYARNLFHPWKLLHVGATNFLTLDALQHMDVD